MVSKTFTYESTSRLELYVHVCRNSYFASHVNIPLYTGPQLFIKGLLGENKESRNTHMCIYSSLLIVVSNNSHQHMLIHKHIASLVFLVGGFCHISERVCMTFNLCKLWLIDFDVFLAFNLYIISIRTIKYTYFLINEVSQYQEIISLFLLNLQSLI